ncbi:peptidase inhibitor family I36 protein [Kitasatospora purpeofusca]|uniref:peptidase inhibitor family I36 protein n=1 Tax=Kitasatospora purpeofusca TaxID=67352 RepID=UPI0035D81A28
MNSVRRYIPALVLTAAFGMGLPLASAPQALADNSGSCSWDNVCLFADSGFWGGVWQRNANGNTSVLTFNLGDAGFNDQSSSWINRGFHDAKWFWGANATGGSECMNSFSNSSYVGWWNNDEASSVQIYTDELAC